MLFLIIFPCCAFPSEFRKHLENGGGNLAYVETPEDHKRLGFFSALYDMAEKRDKPSGEIPRTLHFIWLGPTSFPAQAVSNIRGWIDLHPGWKVIFWTDYAVHAPDDRMQIRGFDMFPLNELTKCYYNCDNFGERSHILRYAILIHEGGVYVDHDMTCVQPIESLCKANDFFCGLESLHESVLSSTVNPSPHFLATTPQHPILKASKKWLLQEWSRLEEQFPGEDPQSIFNRVQHRSFRALSMGIKEACARAGRKDIVYPPNYFSLSKPQHALYATHSHEGSWYTQRNPSDLKTQKILKEIKKGFSQTYGLTFLIVASNMVLFIFLMRRRKKI